MTVSADVQTMMFAEETGDGLFVLLTIAHADLSAPIRVVNNQADVTSGGETFRSFPFELELANADPDNPPRARLTIDNVSREISENIRIISSPPSVTIQIVRISDPDTIEIAFPDFVLRNVRIDANKVTGDLLLEDLQLEPFPAHSFTPGTFPGLY